MNSKKPSIFFAASWHHGYGVTWVSMNGSSAPGRNILAFASRAARDAWVAQGASKKTAPDYREPIARRGMTARERIAAADVATRDFAGSECVEVWT